MRSNLAKVLHPCCDVPLIAHVVKAALQAQLSPIVVVLSPHGGDVQHALLSTFPNALLRFAIQDVARGTGDAARAGLAALADLDLDHTHIAIAYGDTPLIRSHTFEQLDDALQTAEGKPQTTSRKRVQTESGLAFLTAIVDNPFGYGRVVRPDPKKRRPSSVRIVEQRDATPDEQAIQEINAGVYLCQGHLLHEGLAQLTNHNAQAEYYLTDLVAYAAQHGGGAVPVVAADPDDILGVNSRSDLAHVQAIMRRRLITHHQERGVTFEDPNHVILGANVTIGMDTTLGTGLQLRGKTSIGNNAVVEGPTVISDTTIGDGAVIHSFSHLENAVVGAHAHVGPYARLRPHTVLGTGAKVGNFVEIKKSTVGDRSKVNHLAYVGDAQIGADSNIGAGTITCNYDGQHKHPTVIGQGVFVGSNSTLVAPIQIGNGAYIAAGSTITREVPADALAFGRSRQSVREHYAALLRARVTKA